MELGARDTLDEGLGGPGALLELQLSPLDLEVVPASIQLLELDEQLPRAMFAIDRARSRGERPEPENQYDQDERFATEDFHAVTTVLI